MYPNSISSVDEDISAVLSIDELRWLAATDSPRPETKFTPAHAVATAAPGALPSNPVAAKPNSNSNSLHNKHKPTLGTSSPSPARYTPPQDLELALDPETCSLYVESQSLYADAELESGPNAYIPTRTPSPHNNPTTKPTLRSSPPSSYRRPTPTSKLDLATHPHPAPMRVQSPAPQRNRHYRFGEPIHLPFSPLASLPIGPPSPKATPISIPSTPSPSISSRSYLSRSLPTQSTRRPEWIYRHPKPRNPSAPFPTASSTNLATVLPSTPLTSSPPSPSSPSRARTRSNASRKARPQTGYLSRTAQSKPLPPSPKHVGTGAASNPFWSSILRQKPRSRRSIPSLKATVPGIAPPPVPPKSLSHLPFHVRTESTSSTASSGSVYSTNSALTTTASASPVPPTSTTNSRARLHSNSSSTSSGSVGTASNNTNTTSTTSSSSPPHTPNCTPFPSHSSTHSHGHTRAFPLPPPPIPAYASSPAKSILTRSPSVSTTGKHSLSSSNPITNGGAPPHSHSHSASLLSCASKSVTFVDVPTVHYHDASAWGIERVDEEGVYGDTADGRSRDGSSVGHGGMYAGRGRARGRILDMDSDMGLDLDSMDLGMDLGADAGSDVFHTTPITRPKDSSSSLPQPKGLKRLISLSRKPPTPPRATTSRPTISGPFALGSLPDATPRRSASPARSTHSFRSASTCGPGPSLGIGLGTPSSLRSTASIRSARSYHSSRPAAGAHHKAYSLPHSHSYSTSQGYIYGHPTPPGGRVRMGTAYPASVHGLRAAPSCESLGRSVRSLGSVKSSASTRGFRAWLTKIGAGMGLAGVGWEP